MKLQHHNIFSVLCMSGPQGDQGPEGPPGPFEYVDPPEDLYIKGEQVGETFCSAVVLLFQLQMIYVLGSVGSTSEFLSSVVKMLGSCGRVLNLYIFF